MRVAAGIFRSGNEIALAFWPTQLCIGDAADPSDPPSRRRTPRHYASGPGAQPAGRIARAIGAERAPMRGAIDRARRASGMAAVPHAGGDPARRRIEPAARAAGHAGPHRSAGQPAPKIAGLPAERSDTDPEPTTRPGRSCSRRPRPFRSISASPRRSNCRWPRRRSSRR